jgi:hypothetical protein
MTASIISSFTTFKNIAEIKHIAVRVNVRPKTTDSPTEAKAKDSKKRTLRNNSPAVSSLFIQVGSYTNPSELCPILSFEKLSFVA